MKSYDEIVKALMVCTAFYDTSCTGCPYKGVDDCNFTLDVDALDMLQQQHAELERFRASEPTMTEPSEPAPDNVNHPKHYESGKFECIEVMQEALGADVTKHFCLGNAFKYIYRCQKKHVSPVEDVKKAQWYLGKFLELEK